MPARHRSKTSRNRGARTQGWGDMGNGNAGNRGGHGNAGSGKRADSKKPSIWALGRSRKLGFKPKNSVEVDAINIEAINLMIENRKIEKKGDKYEIDLGSLGYDKLLSKGKPKYKLDIKVDSATEKAVSKIKEAGGSVSTSNVTTPSEMTE